MELNADLQNFLDIGKLKTQMVRAHLRIPLYQRPYVWTTDFVTQLIEETFAHIDYERTAMPDERAEKRFWQGEDETPRFKYFAGAVIVVKEESPGGSPLWSIVDGQQRYTTIYLLSIICHKLLCAYFLKLISGGSSNGVLWHQALGLFKANLRILFPEDKASDLSEEASSVFKKIGSDAAPDSLSELGVEFKNYLGEYGTLVGRLTYDRKSYNDDLAAAFHLLDFEGDGFRCAFSLCDTASVLRDANPQKKRYIEAATTIYELLKRKAEDEEFQKLTQSSGQATLAMVYAAQAFLRTVHVAVVATDHQRYAYTLFEVLNNRSMAVDDGAIIRNLFYRRYYQDNPHAADVDGLLRELDRIWDESFKDTSSKLQNIILECGTYIVHFPTLPGKRRKSQARDFILDFTKDHGKGSRLKFSDHRIRGVFHTYRTVRTLVEWAGLTANNRIEGMTDCLKNDGSWLKRAMHLLHALNQEQVLASLLSPVVAFLNRIQGFITADSELRRRMLDQYLRDPRDKTATAIENLAYDMARLAISEDEANDGPETAAEWLKQNHVESLVGQRDLGALVRNHGALIRGSIKRSNLEKWLMEWKYGGSHTKVLWLFSRVMKEGTTGVQTSYDHRPSLDHIEPRNPADTTDFDKAQYFALGDPARGLLVNSLGNMFPLDLQRNMKKSNHPAETIFEDLGSESINFRDHWLARWLDGQLTEFSETIETKKSGNTFKCRVPTREFFERRTESLCKLFCAINDVQMDERAVVYTDYRTVKNSLVPDDT